VHSTASRWSGLEYVFLIAPDQQLEPEPSKLDGRPCTLPLAEGRSAKSMHSLARILSAIIFGSAANPAPENIRVETAPCPQALK